MNPGLKKFSISLLRWTLGIVVLIQSLRFAFSSSSGQFLARAGLPAWIRPGLAGVELIAAVLFLLPYTLLIGSYALLVVFAFSGVVHLLHGWFDVGWLLVYGTAVLVTLTHHEQRNSELIDRSR